jgi:hypothetical protein
LKRDRKKISTFATTVTTRKVMGQYLELQDHDTLSIDQVCLKKGLNQELIVGLESMYCSQLPSNCILKDAHPD